MDARTMLLNGFAHGYGPDVRPYLNGYGAKVLDEVKSKAVPEIRFRYPGLMRKRIARS